MTLRVALALLIFFASPALAEDLSLIPPIDCDLTSSCFIQQYVDHDPSKNSSDFTCSNLSYDGHKGTDFAVRTLAEMQAGVAVLSSAAGIVSGVRDGMPDTGFTAVTAEAVEGRECGNGVVIRHPGGWETQYCHLRQGSVGVKRGQKIAAGAPLGLVGMSGRAVFPHVHLSVRKDRKVIDPFDPDGTVTCSDPSDSTLWADQPSYRAGGLIDVGLSDAVPPYDSVKAGTANRTDLDTQAPALVIYAFTFGTRKADTLRISIVGPEGEVIDQSFALEKAQARAFRAIGKKSRKGWPAGTYVGTATLQRTGKVISTLTRTIELR